MLSVYVILFLYHYMESIFYIQIDTTFRRILPDELKQIQGFPSDFKLFGTKKDKVKQIGNAVPPPLIRQIVKKLYQYAD